MSSALRTPDEMNISLMQEGGDADPARRASWMTFGTNTITLRKSPMGTANNGLATLRILIRTLLPLRHPHIPREGNMAHGLSHRTNGRQCTTAGEQLAIRGPAAWCAAIRMGRGLDQSPCNHSLPCGNRSDEEDAILAKATVALGGVIDHEEIRRRHEMAEKRESLQSELGVTYTVKAYRDYIR